MVDSIEGIRIMNLVIAFIKESKYLLDFIKARYLFLIFGIKEWKKVTIAIEESNFRVIIK